MPNGTETDAPAYRRAESTFEDLSNPHLAAESMGSALVSQANALRDHGQLEQAFSGYRSAIGILEKAVSEQPCSPTLRDTLASAWANLGIAWRAYPAAEGAAQALSAFDRAIDLRESLLASRNPDYRYNLAGAWINRADILQERAQANDLEAALGGYDRALAVLAPLEADADPLILRRITLARLNRAALLLAKDACLCATEVLEAMDQTLGSLGRRPRQVANRGLFAFARTLRAEALVRLERWECAESPAREAIAEIEAVDGAEAAAVGIRARHVLCLCLLRARGGRAEKERLSESVDCAEEGLSRAARWRSDPRVARGISELFRVAAEGYARSQPQFIAEFLEEHLSLAREAISADQANGIASRAVATAMGSVASRAFRAGDAGAAGDSAEVFRDLRRMAERLAS